MQFAARHLAIVTLYLYPVAPVAVKVLQFVEVLKFSR
ncbi:hypothetical protein NIES4071_108750 (plasmid) [Calothrix sp. NIES-4071]|nr:hypothetical protein NIES4071_108750 [Calothrix sp. NIES-4071]BAZ65113.1 hypothetical protein NIES4105_108460 [Calothrix sp. NIES-4105]